MNTKRDPLKLTVPSCFFMTLVLIVSFFTQKVEAHLYPGPISSALGGASVVNVDPTEGPYFNPAILPHLKKEFQTGFVFGQGSTIDTRDDRYWGIQLTDCSKDTFFPAAGAYVAGRTTLGAQAEADERYFYLAGGGTLWKQLTFGIAFNRRETQFPVSDKLVQNNYSLGFVLPVRKELAFGLVFQNLARPGGEIPQYLHLDSKAGIGLYYIYLEKFHVRLDIDQNLNNNSSGRLNFGGGIESRFIKFLAGRLGYRKDSVNDLSILTAGAAFLGPRFSLSYGIQVENQNRHGTRHVLDLELPF